MNPIDPDLSSLLPDEAILKARRAALVDAVSPGAGAPQAAPSRRRRAWRLALVGGVAAATAIVALVLSAGDGGTNSTAFAVEPVAGGGETIKIYSPEDAKGLEEALAEAGIPSQVDWLPAGMGCREPYFEKSSARTASGEAITSRGGAGVIRSRSVMEIGIMSSRQWHALKREDTRGVGSAVEFFNSDPNIVLEPASFRSDQSVVISGFTGPYGGDPEGGFEFHFGIAKGPVEACEPIALPDGGPLGLMNRRAKNQPTLPSGSPPASGHGSLGGI